MAKNGVQDSVHGVQGSVHERRNASAVEEDVRQGLRGLFQFVPKKVGTRFFRVYLRFCAFVPIVPVFNKSSIYKYTYRDPFLYSFSRALGLKNNWNKWNKSHFFRKNPHKWA